MQSRHSTTADAAPPTTVALPRIYTLSSMPMASLPQSPNNANLLPARDPNPLMMDPQDTTGTTTVAPPPLAGCARSVRRLPPPPPLGMQSLPLRLRSERQPLMPRDASPTDNTEVDKGVQETVKMHETDVCQGAAVSPKSPEIVDLVLFQSAFNQLYGSNLMHDLFFCNTIGTTTKTTTTSMARVVSTTSTSSVFSSFTGIAGATVVVPATVTTDSSSSTFSRKAPSYSKFVPPPLPPPLDASFGIDSAELVSQHGHFVVGPEHVDEELVEGNRASPVEYPDRATKPSTEQQMLVDRMKFALPLSYAQLFTTSQRATPQQLMEKNSFMMSPKPPPCIARNECSKGGVFHRRHAPNASLERKKSCLDISTSSLLFTGREMVPPPPPDLAPVADMMNERHNENDGNLLISRDDANDEGSNDWSQTQDDEENTEISTPSLDHAHRDGRVTTEVEMDQDKEEDAPNDHMWTSPCDEAPTSMMDHTPRELYPFDQPFAAPTSTSSTTAADLNIPFVPSTNTYSCLLPLRPMTTDNNRDPLRPPRGPLVIEHAPIGAYIGGGGHNNNPPDALVESLLTSIHSSNVSNFAPPPRDPRDPTQAATCSTSSITHAMSRTALISPSSSAITRSVPQEAVEQNPSHLPHSPMGLLEFCPLAVSTSPRSTGVATTSVVTEGTWNPQEQQQQRPTFVPSPQLLCDVLACDESSGTRPPLTPSASSGVTTLRDRLHRGKEEFSPGKGAQHQATGLHALAAMIYTNNRSNNNSSNANNHNTSNHSLSLQGVGGGNGTRRMGLESNNSGCFTSFVSPVGFSTSLLRVSTAITRSSATHSAYNNYKQPSTTSSENAIISTVIDESGKRSVSIPQPEQHHQEKEQPKLSQSMQPLPTFVPYLLTVNPLLHSAHQHRHSAPTTVSLLPSHFTIQPQTQ